MFWHPKLYSLRIFLYSIVREAKNRKCGKTTHTMFLHLSIHLAKKLYARVLTSTLANTSIRTKVFVWNEFIECQPVSIPFKTVCVFSSFHSIIIAMHQYTYIRECNWYFCSNCRKRIRGANTCPNGTGWEKSHLFLDCSTFLFYFVQFSHCHFILMSRAAVQGNLNIFRKQSIHVDVVHTNRILNSSWKTKIPAIYYYIRSVHLTMTIYCLEWMIALRILHKY